MNEPPDRKIVDGRFHSDALASCRAVPAAYARGGVRSSDLTHSLTAFVICLNITSIRHIIIRYSQTVPKNKHQKGEFMRFRIALLGVVAAILVGYVASSFAQESPYTPGSVWSLTFVKTRGAGGMDYVKNLAENWKKVQDEAIKEGLVLSYKVLWGEAASRDDWDMLLMVESKNFATFDIPEEKWDKIMKKVIGEEPQQKEGDTVRQELREILGSKTMREIILK
jgi:hypothetical protein